MEVNAHSLFSKWFSESGKLISKLFSKIQEAAEENDTLVFVLIDEIESLTSARKVVFSIKELSCNKCPHVLRSLCTINSFNLPRFWINEIVKCMWYFEVCKLYHWSCVFPSKLPGISIKMFISIVSNTRAFSGGYLIHAFWYHDRPITWNCAMVLQVNGCLYNSLMKSLTIWL